MMCVGGKGFEVGFGALYLARRVPSGFGGAGSLDSTRFQRVDRKVPRHSNEAKVPGFGTIALALGTFERTCYAKIPKLLSEIFEGNFVIVGPAQEA